MSDAYVARARTGGWSAPGITGLVDQLGGAGRFPSLHDGPVVTRVQLDS